MALLVRLGYWEKANPSDREATRKLYEERGGG